MCSLCQSFHLCLGGRKLVRSGHFFNNWWVIWTQRQGARWLDQSIFTASRQDFVLIKTWIGKKIKTGFCDLAQLIKKSGLLSSEILFLPTSQEFSLPFPFTLQTHSFFAHFCALLWTLIIAPRPLLWLWLWLLAARALSGDENVEAERSRAKPGYWASHPSLASLSRDLAASLSCHCSPWGWSMHSSRTLSTNLLLTWLCPLYLSLGTG